MSNVNQEKAMNYAVHLIFLLIFCVGFLRRRPFQPWFSGKKSREKRGTFPPLPHKMGL